MCEIFSSSACAVTSWPAYASFEEHRKGRLAPGQLADIVPTFGSINMIGGECDR